MIIERPRVVEEAEHLLKQLSSGGGNDTPEDLEEDEVSCYICGDPSDGVCKQCGKPICFDIMTCAQLVMLLVGTKESYFICRPCSRHDERKKH